jgi:cell filamentation protein
VANYTCSNDLDSAVKNKLGATTHTELEKLEARYAFARDAEIAAGHGPSGRFDAGHLKAIHRHLFQDVYEWAGHTRDEKVALSDGTVATEPMLRKADGKLFMAGPLIPEALERVADTLRRSNYLCGLPREEFAERAADIMVEINGIHPFREGNGRTQRAFIRQLVGEAGQELDFSVVTRERMIQASIAGNEQRDSAMMRRMFKEISDKVRVAALDKAIDALSEGGFPWNESYVATAEPGHRVELTMAGIAGEQFMARTTTAVLIGRTSDLPEPRPARGETFTFEPTPWGARNGVVDTQPKQR